MGMVGAIRMTLGRCWRWSGSPLVVLVCVPALYWQAGYLAECVVEQNMTYGARSVWDKFQEARRYGSFCGVITPICFTIHELNSDEGVRVAEQEDLGSASIIAIDIDRIRIQGLWAPATRQYEFVQILDHYEPTPNGVWDMQVTEAYPEEYFLRALAAVAPVYRETGIEYDPFVERAMRSGQLKYTEPIYAGYAHNALALFLLGMAGRGVFGSRRWWRACKARFRSKKNCCVACGYELKGLAIPRCPECGEGIAIETGRPVAHRDQIAVSDV